MAIETVPSSVSKCISGRVFDQLMLSLVGITTAGSVPNSHACKFLNPRCEPPWRAAACPYPGDGATLIRALPALAGVQLAPTNVECLDPRESDRDNSRLRIGFSAGQRRTEIVTSCLCGWKRGIKAGIRIESELTEDHRGWAGRGWAGRCTAFWRVGR